MLPQAEYFDTETRFVIMLHMLITYQTFLASHLHITIRKGSFYYQDAEKILAGVRYSYLCIYTLPRECFPLGLDLEDHMDLFAVKEADVSRKAWKLHRMIQQYQASFDAIEKVHYTILHESTHNHCVSCLFSCVSGAPTSYCDG